MVHALKGQGLEAFTMERALWTRKAPPGALGASFFIKEKLDIIK
jgi:hypothetical protein